MIERQVLDARTAQQWEDWLEHNHGAADEIWLRPASTVEAYWRSRRFPLRDYSFTA
jgi:hypothetical protein